MAESHVELPGSRRPLATGARRLRDLDPRAHVEVTVDVKAPPLPKADDMPAKTISPEEFAKTYGAAPDDLRKIEETLRSYGLTIEGRSEDGRSLRVSGTASAMEAAFSSITPRLQLLTM